MSLLHIFLVALIQGATEFLPVSSSGHLVLLPALSDLPDQGLLIDVSVHLGTLAAVLVYFRRDVRFALSGTPALLRRDLSDKAARLLACLGIATLPVMAAGLLLRLSGLDAALRSPMLIGATMFGFGLVLYWADRRGAQDHTMSDWSLRGALSLGLWQVLALLPGTSRSGITMTGARLMGFSRLDAARLSMLMSIPVILASGGLLGLEMALSPDGITSRELASAALAALLAGVVALGAIAGMMRLIAFAGLFPFILYRCGLGLALMCLAAMGLT